MYNTFSIPETTESFDFSSTVADVLNATFLGANDTHSNGTLPGGTVKGGMGPVMRIALKVAYMLGIIGNAAAIITLRRGERRMRNRKHLLLLTSLAANDLVALVGMMAAMFASERFPAGGAVPRWYCGARVVLRVFGVGSVCIAVTMALERYLALTRPFLYQKQVTYYMIRTTLLVSWLWAAVLTCAPMLGVGLYYDHEQQRCHRYREATHGVDYGYAVFYVMFGILLCGVLVYCNLAVIRALYAITAPRAGAGPPVVRRVSKRSCRQRKNTAHAHHNAATAEEVAFSRLMATLSVLFMFCWLPQMVTSALYLSMKERRWMMMLSNLADALMLLNYVLDPVLYVLMRQRRQASVATLCHSLADCFKRNHKTSMESTSCCPQETVVVSGDSSGGAEMRPLRPPICTIKFDD